MFIPSVLLALIALFVAIMLTLAWPIQRARFRNQLWDFITLALFVAGFWWLNWWDALSNLAVGVLTGFAAILIRDFRLWLARFKSQV